jgi:hypothetical protein
MHFAQRLAFLSTAFLLLSIGFKQYQHQAGTVEKNMANIGYNYDTEFCNIEKRAYETLSTAEFREKYAGRRPVIVVESHGKRRNERFEKLTTKPALLESYGNISLVLSTANSYTKLKRTVAVKTYLNSYLVDQSLVKGGVDTYYWFGDNHKALSPLTKHFQLNKYSGRYNTKSFGVGGRLSGVPFHFHGGGFSEIMHGSKRWWLHETKPPFNSNQTQLQWLNNVYPSLPSTVSEQLYECTIFPGDLLYFPSHWYHATLNLNKFTAFVSTFTDKEDEFSQGDHPEMASL